MTKDELLEIAVMNGIDADNSMTKKQITDAIDMYNAAEAAQGGADGAGASVETTLPGGEQPAEDAQDGAEKHTEG